MYACTHPHGLQHHTITRLRLQVASIYPESDTSVLGFEGMHLPRPEGGPSEDDAHNEASEEARSKHAGFLHAQSVMNDAFKDPVTGHRQSKSLMKCC